MVYRAQMTSTGNCAVVCQVRRGKTVKLLENDHGKLELYSLTDGQPVDLRKTGVIFKPLSA